MSKAFHFRFDKQINKMIDKHVGKMTKEVVFAAKSATRSTGSFIKKEATKELTHKIRIERRDMWGFKGSDKSPPRDGQAKISSDTRSPDFRNYSVRMTASRRRISLNRFRIGNKETVPSQKGLKRSDSSASKSRGFRSKRKPVQYEVYRGVKKVRRTGLYFVRLNGNPHIARNRKGKMWVQHTKSLSGFLDQFGISERVGLKAATFYVGRIEHEMHRRLKRLRSR